MKISINTKFYDERTIEGIQSCEFFLKEGLSFLIGPSGAGKTTVLQEIQKTYQGIYLEDLIYQGTVLEFLGVDENSARSALSDVELDIKIYEQCQNLSSGQKKRVLLAKILTEREKIFLLDETFSGLDQELRLDLLGFLKRMSLERNHKILYVTHYMEEISEKDYIYFISSAKLLAEGSFGKLYNNPTSFEVGKFLGSYNHMIVEKNNTQLHTPFGTIEHQEDISNGFYLMFFRKEHTIIIKEGPFKGVLGSKIFKHRLVTITKKENSIEACFLLQKDLEDNLSFDIELYHLWRI